MSHSWSFWRSEATDPAADSEAARDLILHPFILFIWAQIRACLEERGTQCLLGYGLPVHERETEGAELRSRPSSSPPRVTCQREAQPPGLLSLHWPTQILVYSVGEAAQTGSVCLDCEEPEELLIKWVCFVSCWQTLTHPEEDQPLSDQQKTTWQQSVRSKMPAKTPMYLKTTTPKKGKKLKLRDVLSGDMISPPLGDVRHSAHVGPEGEGDMFGDVGFLQGKMSMLPSLSRTQNGHSRSHSVERGPDDGFSAKQDSHSYAYNGYHYQHSSSGLLKTTISMPVFIAHEQAPPKPPRLHLDDPSPASLPPQQNHFQNHQAETNHKQANGFGHADGHRQQHPTRSLFDNGVVGRLASEPCRDISISPNIRRLVPSSGSFSEVSSEDSMSEICGPLDVRRGLSLDSDAGLSNEDLRSERSDSPCAAFQPAGLTVSSNVTRSDSMAGLDLDLDLGPSILEDVLSIMDRFKTEDNRCELWRMEH